MADLLSEFIQLAESKIENKSTWREYPVDLLTFFTSPDYLHENPYPGKQTELLEIVNSIVQHKIIGNSDVCPEDLRQVTELVVLFGKGAGKDFLASSILTYMCYVILCLSDPHDFFGFGKDTRIDLINMAINAYQANNVFFAEFKAKLMNCNWFHRVSYNPSQHPNATFRDFQLTKNQVRFYKNITAHSAHSEADSFEGFNPLVIIFDEIDGFEPVAAESAYTTLRSSAVTRYNDKVLLIFISFPRSSDGFMLNKYKESQTDPQVYGIKGKSWEVNPSMKRESLQKEYDRDPEKAKMLYESLTGDTLIWTTEGIRRLDTLIDGGTIRTRLGNRDIMQFIHSGVKDIYEVITKEGYSIKGSANHPMLKYTNKALWAKSSTEWTKIGDLKKGDRLYLDINNDIYGNGSMSKSMAYLLGMLIGDGTFGQRKNGSYYATWYFEKDSVLVTKVKNCFESEFGFTPQIKSYPSRGDTTIRTDRQKPLKRLKELGIVPGDLFSKQIPKAIYYQPKDVILEFIKGWYDADGTINKNTGVAVLGSSNPILLKELQHLLLYVGVRSRIIAPNKPSTATNPKGLEFTSKNHYRLTLSKQESTLFNNLIKLTPPNKQKNQLKCLNYNDCNNYKHQLEYTEVAEIKYIGKQMCYDIWIEPDNEFTANGLAAHNCNPPLYSQGLFQFPEKIDDVVVVGKKSQNKNLIISETISTRTLKNGVEKHFKGLELHNLNLNPSYTYYLGGDGGVKGDSYVISLFHAEPTLMEVVDEEGNRLTQWVNKPVEDLILEWKPSKKDRLPVDLLNVADILEKICRQVYVKKALFDKFNSAEVTQRLMSYGVDAEDKNFSNPFQVQIYQNLKSLIYTGNISLLDHTIENEYDSNRQNANEELKAIKLINGTKIDHDPDKAKDFSDARASAVWICSTDEPEQIEHFAMPVILGVRVK